MKRLFKKVMRDLFQDKRRAFFSFLAILIGMVSFGIIAFSYQIINRELVHVYEEINPASGSIIVNQVDDNLIALTEKFEGIASFEQKSYNQLQVHTQKKGTKPLELFSAQDFSALRINQITSESGSFSPKEGEVLIERDALKVGGVGIGDQLTFLLPDGTQKELTITGIVADIGLHPASIHDTVYAYVSFKTLQEMGLAGNKIDYMITGERYDRERILTISNDYIKVLEDNGYVVSNLEVSATPGLSMHLEEYESALFLLQIFSFVTFLFGCMIMSSLITSIIAGQTRQIGILKGIGASTEKIMGAYMLAFFVLIAVIGGLSLLLTRLFAGGVSSFLMGIGNMRPAEVSVPVYLYIVYSALTLLVPMIIAYIPIRRGVTISVKDALSFYGVSTDDCHVTLPEPKFLSRPVVLSLRNALRRKKRFYLNITILSIAGALFVAVVTAMISTQTTLSKNLDSWKFDYHYLTNSNYETEELAAIMAAIPSVTAYENWGSSKGMVSQDNGDIVSSYPIVSPQDSSNMITPEILEGRWLTDEDTNAIVVSHKFLASESRYQIGDTVTLLIGNQVSDFAIVGSMKDFGTTTIYISQKGYQQYVPDDNQLSNIKLNLKMDGRRKTVYKATEADLKAQGVLMLQIQSKKDLSAIASGHYAVTLQTFLFIIVMLVIVSGFGLAATMNVQTSERTKEIGIMKAMGADKKQITKIVTFEGQMIALISWGVSVILGIPLGIVSVMIFGNKILEIPLQFNVPSLLISYLIWLALTLVIGYYASRGCAKSASQMSIRDSLEC